MNSKLEKVSHSEAQNIAKNLSLLIATSKKSELEIAQTVGIPVMTIRRLTSGETTDPRVSTLKLLADYFNVPISTLIDDNTETTVKLIQNSKPIFVPLLNWKTLEKTNDVKKINFKNWEDWIPLSINNNCTIGEMAFGIESRKSMYPRFQNGTIFIINPLESPTDGDLVLVRIKKNNEITLRELVIDPPVSKLISIVGSDVIDYSSKQYEILGVVVLTLLFGRKYKT